MKSLITILSLGLLTIAIAASAVAVTLDVIRFPEPQADEPTLTVTPARRTPADLQPTLDVIDVQRASGDWL